MNFRTVGVGLARTPYVAFSDDDSWRAGGALATAERVLDRHPRVGAVAGRSIVGREGRADPVTWRMAASPLDTPDGSPGPVVLGFPAHAAVVRREAYLAAGGFSRHGGTSGDHLPYPAYPCGIRGTRAHDQVQHTGAGTRVTGRGGERSRRVEQRRGS